MLNQKLHGKKRSKPNLWRDPAGVGGGGEPQEICGQSVVRNIFDSGTSHIQVMSPTDWAYLFDTAQSTCMCQSWAINCEERWRKWSWPTVHHILTFMWYLINNYVTNWLEYSPSWRASSISDVEKFQTFHDTRNFISVFETTRYWRMASSGMLRRVALDGSYKSHRT
jgi:hypothetical protein